MNGLRFLKITWQKNGKEVRNVFLLIMILRQFNIFFIIICKLKCLWKIIYITFVGFLASGLKRKNQISNLDLIIDCSMFDNIV